MNPNQQPIPNPQNLSPYRHNYHINPAESKIIYQNPQNTAQLRGPNNINLIQIQNPQNLPVQYFNSPPQFNQTHLPMQVQPIQNQQNRARSLSPIGTIPTQNMNQNQIVMFQSPPPQNIIYSFEAPQNRQIITGQKILNQPMQQPMQGGSFQLLQNPGHYVHQNSMPLIKNNSQIMRAMSPSIQNIGVSNMTFSNSSGVSFRYQNQLAGGQNQFIGHQDQVPKIQNQNPIMTSLAHAFQKNMGLSMQKPLLESAVNINLNSVAPQRKIIQQSAVNINLNSVAPQRKIIQQSAININFNSVGSHQIQESGMSINWNSVNSTIKNLPVLLKEPQSMPPAPNILHELWNSENPISQTTQGEMFYVTHSYDLAANKSQALQQSIKQPQLLPVPPPLNPNLPQQVPQIQEIQQNYTQNAQQILQNPIWEQRFIMIYQKFQWFYERYDFISREFQILSQEFQNVNSEDEWLELKEKHDLLLEKIQQIQEELVNTIHENQELAEQYELENRNSKQSDEVQRVWQHRYHELLEQYKSLSQNYADLQSQGNNPNNSQSQHSQNKGGLSVQQQAEMQNKFHQLESEYNVLCDEYEKIRVEYERIYEENTQYSKENSQLMNGQEQARNMASQLQAYVEELQHQNDQLRKQERKSTPSQQNYIPREEFEKMQYHFNEEIQKYEEELQKYRMALQQYEQKTQMNRQQLQKISEIAMEKESRIRQLEHYQNTNSKSGHSNNNIPQNENHDLQRRYVNILEQDVRLWREKQTDLVHKLQLKDMERRSLEEKNHYLEKQLDITKVELQRLARNFNEKLSKIEQNTNSHIQRASRHVIEQEVVRPLGNTQYETQIHDLQNQLHELQNILNSKMTTYHQLQQSIQNYESQLRKQSNTQSITEIQFQKKISEIEIDMNKKVAQKYMKIAVMNSEIQRLKDICENVKREKISLKQSFKSEFLNNEEQLNQRHNSRVSELEKKIDDKSSEVAYVKEILQKYEKQLKMKNEELMELRNFVGQIKKSASSTNISPGRNDYQLIKQELKLKQEILQRKNEQLKKIKRQKEYKVKHITEIEHELEQVNSELSKRRAQVSSLKRQLNDMQQLQSQYESRKSGNNKKILQINQLKQELFEIVKLRMENESQRRDIERFSQENKDKYKEIQKLKQENYQLERKFTFSKNNNSNTNINNAASFSRHQGMHDDSEVSELRELIRKKDSQISRINQSLHESQYLLENRSRQLDIQKSQLSALTKSKQSEVSSLTHNISSFESRVKDSESKRNKIIEETNQLRAKFQEQLQKQSQRQKAYYDKVITRYEDDYKALKKKLRTYEEACNKMEIDLEKAKTSEKNLQIQLSEINKKLITHQSQTLQKQEIFSTFRQKQTQSQQSTKALYEKLSALELQLKTKQQQMKLSEEKNSILEQKIKKNKKDNENFRNKIMVSQQLENNNSVVQYLSKRIAEYESKMINQSERDFGFKIKDQSANHVFENQVVYHLKVENQMLRKELEGKGIQYDRQVLNQLEEENLKISKNLLRNSTFSSKLGNINSNLLIKDNIEDVNFYKEKNKQLQERVEKHLKCNKQLKDKIQFLIKGNSESKQLQYFKEQITEYEHKITQLQKKVQALTEENKNINKGMQKRQSRVEEHYEDRIKQLESRLTQMTKTIEQLTQQKSDLQISKSELQMQKVTINEEIKRLNEKISSLQSSKNQKYEQQVIQLRQKCENYESEITKITNRARILEQEIKRLNETNSNSKLSLNELNGLKLKIQELTNLLTKADRQLHEEQAKSNSLSNEVASLQLKCRTWQSETERLKEMNELYAKKQRNDLSEGTVQKQSSSGLQSQISTLQAQISSISSEKYELEARISSFIQQLKYYESLIPSLMYDLEFIRSDTLVQETLIQEMVIGGDNTAECIDGLRVNVQRKMYWLDQLFNKVRKL